MNPLKVLIFLLLPIFCYTCSENLDCESCVRSLCIYIQTRTYFVCATKVDLKLKPIFRYKTLKDCEKFGNTSTSLSTSTRKPTLQSPTRRLEIKGAKNHVPLNLTTHIDPLAIYVATPRPMYTSNYTIKALVTKSSSESKQMEITDIPTMVTAQAERSIVATTTTRRPTNILRADVKSKVFETDVPPIVTAQAERSTVVTTTTFRPTNVPSADVKSEVYGKYVSPIVTAQAERSTIVTTTTPLPTNIPGVDVKTVAYLNLDRKTEMGKDIKNKSTEIEPLVDLKSTGPNSIPFPDFGLEANFTKRSCKTPKEFPADFKLTSDWLTYKSRNLTIQCSSENLKKVYRVIKNFCYQIIFLEDYLFYSKPVISRQNSYLKILQKNPFFAETELCFDMTKRNRRHTVLKSSNSSGARVVAPANYYLPIMCLLIVYVMN